MELSVTPRSLYPRGNRPRYPLDGRMGVLQSHSRRYGKEKNFAPPGNRILAVQPIDRPYTD
jgi:hypothetical protein